ncbi:hypothetical protein CO051_01165 [Candidatus Roizmanbacteria bacterium CG_4_9_14_0_2_um_filter_39_13]|uniref:EfeO-type cupredoxin-like domain-containing protein n=2 Tax=Candidatus Roizmaniibacteriota TaxID=1752723 RepID=A0A2M8F323_9BACT|nr:MAG: hypothetical protein COY15_01580 [Candidatus Roizmanbacteria bacterium CG_4_10_14_0_2_um_filter_39_12]PJC33714.1 MAG: hypothetical protein CO051_01165 [Candidatus Roizmanbacteria bacterium CG_4_9_14_0_2_um_filter_39_13]PJE62052.1 MAG: hypothetical protein COU87_01325 [Candidatus Roizmanbacteria bacterium CG10_big_fil_rev_8_21_14_0_10_39_12]
MEETIQTPEPNNGSMKMIVVVVVVLALIGGYMYMQKGKSSETASTEEGAKIVVKESSEEMTEKKGTEESMEVDETADKMKVRVIEVEAGSFYYKPSLMKVKKGETVRIVMSAVSMMHDFNIDELGVKLPIVKDGDTGTVEFVADKVGSFEYYCSVANHRAQGQVGMITVE